MMVGSTRTGRFALAVSHRVNFVLSSSDNHFFLKRVLVKGVDLTDSDISLKASEKIQNVFVVVSDEVREMSGIVTNTDEDVGTIHIVLVPEDPTRWDRLDSYIHAYASGTTSFSLQGVPQGRYLVFAVPLDVPLDGERFIQEHYASARAITVRAQRRRFK